MKPQYRFFIYLALLILAACGQNLTVEQKMCRIAIEDVFLPANKLTINDVGFSETTMDIQIPVEYSIVDATGKRVKDTAICTFDKASTAEPKQIKSILQFNNEIPAPYVQFINKRVTRKMLIAAGQKPPAEQEVLPTIIPQDSATEAPAPMPANIPPPPK